MTDEITPRDQVEDEPEMEVEATEEAVVGSMSAPDRRDAMAAADAIGWQKLWIETQRRPWRSLAIVPSCASIETLEVARVLAIIGQRHLGRRFLVIDATQLSLQRLEEMKETIAAHVRRNEHVIVALRPIGDSPTSLALAESVDSALLAVALGETRIDVAERIIEQLGPDRIVGSFILHERKEKRRAPPPEATAQKRGQDRGPGNQ